MKIRFMELSKKLSFKSLHKFRHGSVIVKGNRIISIGYNSTKTHTKSLTSHCTLHAETDAILSAGFTDLTGTVLYVYRSLRNNDAPGNSKPCDGCEKLARQANISKIYFSTEIYPYWEEMKL